jgi:hypothetical protein
LRIEIKLCSRFSSQKAARSELYGSEDKNRTSPKQQKRPGPNQLFRMCLVQVVVSEGVRSEGEVFHRNTGSLLVATAARAGAATFPCLIAVTTKYGTITAWFKWNSGGLAAAGADNRCSMGGRSLAIAGASPTLFALLCLTARLAALGGRITAFLKERLISSGERKVLSTVTARKLNISGHGVSSNEIVHRDR